MSSGPDKQESRFAGRGQAESSQSDTGPDGASTVSAHNENHHGRPYAGRHHDKAEERAYQLQLATIAFTAATAAASCVGLLFAFLNWHEAHEGGKVQVEQAIAAQKLANAATAQAEAAKQLVSVARQQVEASQAEAAATAAQAATQKALLAVEADQRSAQRSEAMATISSLRAALEPSDLALRGLGSPPAQDGMVHLSFEWHMTNVGGSSATPTTLNNFVVFARDINSGQRIHLNLGNNEISVRPGTSFGSTEPFPISVTPAQALDLRNGTLRAYVWGKVGFRDLANLTGAKCYAAELMIKKDAQTSSGYVSVQPPKGFCTASSV